MIASRAMRHRRTRVRLLEKPLKLMMKQNYTSVELRLNTENTGERKRRVRAIAEDGKTASGLAFEEELRNIDVCWRSRGQSGCVWDSVTTL